MIHTKIAHEPLFYNDHAIRSLKEPFASCMIMIYAYANKKEDDDATFADFFLGCSICVGMVRRWLVIWEDH